ncbi:lasso peptide biosynthesis B2 protein [Caldalkalibacillus mannanilyticus]|uniref:lasso peptide biosynthesis B2 protein n=1 Tax=Caldalkalibacillus mannanilyticus TaxID=1418 RepID=UPI000468DF77|nr:lasso peptide biosynthesis B2 protein [Caldalkalibacillus mannanilyticus]
MVLKKIYWYIYVLIKIIKINGRLKKEGIKSVHQKHFQQNKELPELRNVPKEEVEFIYFILNIIDAVCFYYIGKARCLHRSVAGYEIFMKKKIPIDLVVGVSKFPFMAHAWLEYNGRVVNDEGDMRNKYTIQMDTSILRKKRKDRII